MGGTVGSGLTPGSPPDGQFPAIPVPSGFRAGKQKMAQWFALEVGAKNSEKLPAISNHTPEIR